MHNFSRTGNVICLINYWKKWAEISHSDDKFYNSSLQVYQFWLYSFKLRDDSLHIYCEFVNNIFEFILYCFIMSYFLLFLWTSPCFLDFFLIYENYSGFFLSKMGYHYFPSYKQIPLAIRLHFLLSRSERVATANCKSRPEVSTTAHWPDWPAVYFWQLRFIVTQPHPSTYKLAMEAFLAKWQSSVGATFE